MVATRRSRSFDTVKVEKSTKQQPLKARSASLKKPNPRDRNVECDGEEEAVKKSVRLRRESPPLLKPKQHKNANRSLDDEFEWDMRKNARNRKPARGFETKELGFATGLRRSSRHRSASYRNLSEDYIQYKTDILEGKRGSYKKDLDESLEKSSAERKEKNKTELRDLLAAQGKNLSDVKSHMEPDIYSSVKSRVRVSTRKKLYEEYYTSESSRKKHEEEEESQSEEMDEEDEDDEQTNEERDTEEEEEEEEDEDEGHPYKLRKVREAPKRYMIVREVRRRRPRSLFEDLPCSPVRRRRTKTSGSSTRDPYHKRLRRARTQGNSSTSEEDSSSDDEIKFRKRQQKSMARARNECLPINLSSAELGKHSYARERKKIGQSLADIDPMGLDASVTFSSIGGHSKHIRALKEMVVFPLLYPEVFEKFSITPPRGCLFYGPPGTGKTLMARALANECSTEGKRVSFFMKKGADCLSKWIGESERQLRVLFDQAYQMRPSIIFFDEIDGLAPVRSSRQDQIHSSIVSTLLALMDGLDSRGEIIVIGATNRIDSIDPALRRPGRFDREFLFPLPDKKAREAILGIHTKAWNPQLKASFIEYLATKTVGYCGADLKALCTEAALFALRRRYPQIYESREKLQLDISTIKIEAADFQVAVKNIIPTAQRSATNPGHGLSSTIKPLLGQSLQKAVLQLATLFPALKGKSKLIQQMENQEAGTQSTVTSHDNLSDGESDGEFVGTRQGIYVGEPDDEDRFNTMMPLIFGSSNGMVHSKYSKLFKTLSSTERSLSMVHRPRFLICGQSSSGHISHLAPALLHDMEGVPIHCLDLPALYGISVRTPEESCAQVFREARRLTPSVIYLPNALPWWSVASPTIQATLVSLLQDIPSDIPILFLATANCSYRQLPRELAKFFHPDFDEVYETSAKFSSDERREFFAPVFLIHASTPPPKKRSSRENRETLAKAPTPEPAPLTEEEEKKLQKEEESTLRNLRLFLRDVLMRLGTDRRFKIFSKPVDSEEVPDYVEVIKTPMDFSTMHTKVDQHKYQTVQMFLEDIDLICSNALEYNPDRRPEDKLIRHRACAMRDMAHAIVDTDLEPEFEKLCREIVESRERRGVTMNKFAPKFYPVLPKHLMVHPITGEITPKPDLEQSNETKLQGNKLDDVLEKPQSKGPQKKLPNMARPKRKRSSWSRGIVSRSKRKKVVQILSGEEEDEGGGKEQDDELEEENHKSFQDQSSVTDESDSDDVENGKAYRKDDGKIVELREAVESCETKDFISMSFESGAEMEIDAGQDALGDSNTEQDDGSEAKDKDSCISNGYGLDDIQQDELEEVCYPRARQNPERNVHKGGKDSSEGETLERSEDSRNHDGQKIIEIQERSDEDPTPPTKMTLRSCEHSTSESHPIQEDPPPPLVVDHKRLLELLEELVLSTDSYTLEELERTHASLLRCVNKYKMKYNRSDLIQDLEREIHSLSSHVTKYTSAQSSTMQA